jgi:hypothetical protein
MRFLLILALLASPSFAREPFNSELPMMCGDTNNLVTNLRDKYGEEAVMMAPSKNEYGDDLFHSLWYNAGTTTWSFIVVNKQKGLTCVIASGEQAKMFFPGT